METATRPVLHCFVAYQRADRRLSHVELVTLDEAAARHMEGWMVVGPDPEDEADLLRWEREQHTPRWWR